MNVVDCYNKLNSYAKLAKEEVSKGEPINSVVRAFICKAQQIYISLFLIIDNDDPFCRYIEYLMGFNSNAGDIKNFCKVHDRAMLIMKGRK